MGNTAASLIIPSHGGAHRLPVLFDALRRQRFAGDWEAIVVLDGDIDGSAAVLDAVDDLPVRSVRFDENRGRPAALNAGFEAARGRVLIRCDDDLEPGPTYVADHVLAHSGSRPVGAVGLYRNVLPPTPYARVYGRPYDVRFRTEAYAAPADTHWRYWAGNCSVTAQTHQRVGPYDERFRAYGWEDIDWGHRLWLAGVPVVLDPRLETRHHAANTDVMIRTRRAFQSGRARTRFDAKHGFEPERADPVGAGPRLWAAAVEAMAGVRSLEEVERRGAALDRILGRLPGPLAVKAVALLVESAAIAGYRSAVESPTAD